jgi:hypothetical protein
MSRETLLFTLFRSISDVALRLPHYLPRSARALPLDLLWVLSKIAPNQRGIMQLGA